MLLLEEQLHELVLATLSSLRIAKLVIGVGRSSAGTRTSSTSTY